MCYETPTGREERERPRNSERVTKLWENECLSCAYKQGQIEELRKRIKELESQL